MVLSFAVGERRTGTCSTSIDPRGFHWFELPDGCSSENESLFPAIDRIQYLEASTIGLSKEPSNH